MCFSDTASFVVASACTVVGVYAVFKPPSRKYLPLAIIPLAFGMHQAAEGVVWQALGQSAGSSVTSHWVTLFVFIATIFWPVFVPVAALQAEEDRHRKKVLIALTAVGSLVSLVYIVRLVNADVIASVSGSSVMYTSQIRPGIVLPSWLLSEAQGGSDWILVPYAFATIGSLAWSTHLALRLFAVVVALALAVLMVANQTTLVSVWCFLAASGSILIFPAIRFSSLRLKSAADQAAFASGYLP